MTKELLSRDELDPFQLAAGLFIEQTGSCALWVDMGLGKTIVCLTRISDKIFSGQWRRVLVVAPPLVATDTWPVEAASWEHTRYLTLQQMDGETADMKRQLENHVDIDVISVHKLQRLAACFKRGYKSPYDCVILDESSMYRNKTSKRWRAAVRLSWQQELEVIELTGTPNPNGLQQLWAQICLLDGGKRLFPTYKTFLAHFFHVDNLGRKITPKKFALQSITERVADLVYTLRDDDFLDLPPLRHYTVPIVLPPKIMQQYLDFERTSVLKWSKEEQAVRALSEGALYGKLLQFACGRIYTDAAENKFTDLHDLKIQRIKEMVEFSDGTPIIIARTWKHSAARLKDEFPYIRQIKNSKDIAEWNAGDIPLVETHPASIGHGTNIQHGGNNLIFYDHTPDLELYLQLRARLRRRGQKASRVNIGHLTATGTIEEDLTRNLVRKEIMQDATREPMRRRLKDVLRELSNGRT